MMDTLLDATRRLRAADFDVDFSATVDGLLRCGGCGLDHDPAGMTILEIVRYEGASDPDDQSILLAVRAQCGCRGLYSAAYGADTAMADVEVLHRLAPT